MADSPHRPQPRPGGRSATPDWRSGIFDAWGNSAPNHWADRAGRHRRVAIGFSALAIPLATMAWAALLDGGFLTYSLAHLVMASCFLWVARDLIRWASLVGRNRLPHSSLIALFIAVALVHYTRPPELALRFGSIPGLTVGAIMLGAALLILAIDDRKPNPLVALPGRMMLISGGAIAGLAEIARMVRGWPEYPLYSVGLGGSGILLGAMALFEGRLLRRALALARLGHRKTT